MKPLKIDKMSFYKLCHVLNYYFLFPAKIFRKKSSFWSRASKISIPKSKTGISIPYSQKV